MAKRKMTSHTETASTGPAVPIANEKPIKETVYANQVAVEEVPIIEEVPPPPEPMTGVVINCDKLRVRMASNAAAPVKCEIEKGSEVLIDPEASMGDFYAVYTSAGVFGFCMKKFIAIK